MDTTLKRYGDKLKFKTHDPAEESIKVTWGFKSKRKKKPKSKKERQNWWYSLTPEEQNKYIEGIQNKKAQKNRIRDARKATKEKNCLTCFHYKVKACDGVSDKYSCKYWFDAMDLKEWAA